MEEQEKCAYCQLGHTIVHPRGLGNVSMEISDVGLPCIYFRVRENVTDDGNRLSLGVRIKYCPMCGRRLGNGN